LRCIVLVCRDDCRDGRAACFISAAYAYRPVELAMIEKAVRDLAVCLQTQSLFSRRMRWTSIATMAGLKTKQ
tara:strand:- start:21253 stop:21468 length:216 start_codon:yes stop_codon:yes gene_type:complete